MRNDAILGLVAITLSACAATVTPQSVRQEIEAAVPVGSPSERVIAFLNERGWNDGAVLGRDDVRPPSSLASGDTGPLELRTIIRKTRKRWPVSYSIAIVFTFDDQRRVTGVQVSEVGTGP